MHTGMGELDGGPSEETSPRFLSSQPFSFPSRSWEKVRGVTTPNFSTPALPARPPISTHNQFEVLWKIDDADDAVDDDIHSVNDVEWLGFGDRDADRREWRALSIIGRRPHGQRAQLLIKSPVQLWTRILHESACACDPEEVRQTTHTPVSMQSIFHGVLFTSGRRT